jgi:hypothetical protein
MAAKERIERIETAREFECRIQTESRWKIGTRSCVRKRCRTSFATALQNCRVVFEQWQACSAAS